jgi:hypothetical protein
MFPIKVIAAIAALSVAMLACTFTFNDQMRGVTIGSAETTEIEVPAPDSDQVTEVKLEFGAGELNIAPGDSESLISGTAAYNVVEFEPKITVADTRVKISQQVDDINLIPVLGDELKNRWDLSFGNFPIDLEIAAGGYQGEFELGGIPIHDLRIAEGASKTDVSFSELNPVEMDTLRYDTGASQATLSGLANANFREMDFRSGAGDYRLDFSGDLQQDAEVSIKTGLSSIVIIVPQGTPATVQFEGGLANVDRSGSWRMSGNVYTLPGEGPELIINVEMGAGNLELRER